MLLGWVTVLFLFPFLVNAIFQGRYIDSLLILILACFAGLNSLSIFYKKYELIAYRYIFLIKLSILFFIVYELGHITLFWSYPLVFGVFFVQPCFQARLMSGIAAVMLIALSTSLFEAELVFRYSLTLLMLIIFCDILIGILINMESKLMEQTIRDPLTNAHNRRYMNSILEMTIEETHRNFGPATLITLDIDHFKEVNDKFGHISGDNVLIKLVDLLHKRQRKLDYVFRSGGEEFVLILRNMGLQQALSLAESIRGSVEETGLLEGETITVSLGVAEYEAGETEVEWLHRADELLYEAKNSGRNCVRPAVLNELYN